MPKDHRSTRALAAAQRLYKRKPDASTDEFRKVCERADKAMKKLSNRELNASYVLPFRRSKALKGKSTGKRTSKRSGGKPRGVSRSEREPLTEQIAWLVRQRDGELLKASNNPARVYELAAQADDFAASLVRAMRK